MRAALISHGKLNIGCRVGSPGHGQQADQLEVIDLLLAEVFIGLDDARGQRKAAELNFRAGCFNCEAAPVQVIAVRDLPDEPHAVGPVGEAAEAERLIRW